MMPLPPAPAWRALAGCRGTKPELWFPARGDTQAIRQAHKVCAGCLVREECLEYALAHREEFGIWGGLSEGERKRIRRRRNREGQAVRVSVAGDRIIVEPSRNGVELSLTSPHEAPEATGTSEEPSKRRAHLCQGCGTSLEGRRPSTRWCSRQCRNRHRKRNQRDEVSITPTPAYAGAYVVAVVSP